MTLVCGPPGAGKSTYVAEHFTPGDLIVDFDRLFTAVSSLPVYEQVPELGRFVITARQAILRELALRPGALERAWVLAGAPQWRDREALRRQLGAEVVILATPREECLARISADGERDPIDLMEWEEKVDRWWSRFQSGRRETVIGPALSLRS